MTTNQGPERGGNCELVAMTPADLRVEEQAARVRRLNTAAKFRNELNNSEVDNVIDRVRMHRWTRRSASHKVNFDSQ
ncbi:hypothetical protein HOD30_03335 [Candidatus Peregrinibacteria bacterium]|jgi:hypothetical protein|nr:hypothetical protein [Candidatus Peregrinibacteria bacterium]MBT4631659.1 hypothetical protein [Candidatus Peregrinibacteria bacterium]MBT5516787.1 hypothetical protein [Candidatus Peregrinibacteria bacterium]MBT5823931.1 hypothetical protein [Candidatus Peregrinibacteria bacterium]